MKQTIKTYFNLKNKGMSKAWEISGMPELFDKAVGAVCWAVGISCVLYLISSSANAAVV